MNLAPAPTDQLADAGWWIGCEICAQSSLALYDILVISDELVVKGLLVPEMAQIARNEDRLRQLLLAQWRVRSKQAVERSHAVWMSSGDLAASMAAVDVVMSKWADDVKGRFTQGLIDIYTLGREAGTKRAAGIITRPLDYTVGNFTEQLGDQARIAKATPRVATAFDVYDASAVTALMDEQMLWIGRHYGANVSETIRRSAREQIVGRGLGRREAGKLLRDDVARNLDKVTVPKGFNGSQAKYFEGLAANAATIGRVRGQIRSFQDLGVTRYVLSNPMDRRTTRQCIHMNGKVFTVQNAVNQIERTAGATSPDDIKRDHPWLSMSQILAVSPVAGRSTAADSGKLAAAGFSLPPFHFRCMPGSTTVQGQVEMVSKRLYSGEIVEILTESGRRIALTPNHPVLAVQGFVSAESVHNGMDLVCYKIRTERLAVGTGISLNVQNKPAAVQHVFESLFVAFDRLVIRRCPGDFYGESDVMDGKIHVVSVDSKLSGELKTRFQERIIECRLNFGESAARPTSALGRVGSGDHLSVSNCSSAGSTPGCTALSCDQFNSIRSRFHPEPLDSVCFGPASDLGALSPEEGHDSVLRDSVQLANRLRGLSGLVELDRVVSVRRFPFRGHVYDLQTRTGWIIAEGAFISNCRTTVDIAPGQTAFKPLTAQEQRLTIPAKPRPTPKPRPAVAKPLAKPKPTKKPTTTPRSMPAARRPATMPPVDPLAVLQAPVNSFKPLGGGANSSELLELENGISVVWKPAAGESATLTEHVGGALHKREAAAYQIDQIVGTNVVPRTALRKYGGEVGSVQEFIGSAVELDMASPAAIASASANSAQRMSLLDVIIGNTDRHSGNVMVAKIGGKQQFVAIDNGFSMQQSAQLVRRWYYNGEASYEVSKSKALAMFDFRPLAANLEAASLADTAAALAASGVERDAATQVVGRLAALKRHPMALHRTVAGAEGESPALYKTKDWVGGEWKAGLSAADTKAIQTAISGAYK